MHPNTKLCTACTHHSRVYKYLSLLKVLGLLEFQAEVLVKP